MATRAATFTAKIRNLKDYHYRMVNNVSPQTSGIDVANTLKYFSQTLLSVLKDVPIIPKESYGPRQTDSVRLSVFPSLSYSGLFEAVLRFVDIVPFVQLGQHALAESILGVLGCLVPFLEYDLLDTMPFIVASALAIFPKSLHKEIIDLLSTNLLPVTLGYEGMNTSPTYATDSTSAILMMVFQYVEEGAYHSQLLECIMSYKKNVCKDLLCVIAHGPVQSRPPAVHYLFHYWPQLNPALTDRTGIHYKYFAWEPIICQKEGCPNRVKPRASKMCLDSAISISSGDRPPPIFLCVDCVDMLRRDHVQYLADVLKPLQVVSLKCENKNCASPKNEAMCTCFSLECASLNGFRPVRYCRACHTLKHGEDAPGAHHVYHATIPDIWSCDAETKGYLVEAIVSLLKEAEPMEEKRTVEMGEERTRHHFEEDDDEDSEGHSDRKLLSRYGVWLLVELCKPQEQLQIEVLGRLLAMLFQWFDATAYLPDDNIGNSLERLKPQYIWRWLKEISKTHFEVIVSCLLPHPIEYARVGGHWDTLSSRTTQIKEGLNRLCCLIPYNVITFEVWDYVIPYWLEAICTEVPREERHELKVLLRKMFDIDMSPLPFPPEKMYSFLSSRFVSSSTAVQEQNLMWMQLLTSLDIIIPFPLILIMFRESIHSLTTPPPPTTTDAPPNSAQQPIHSHNMSPDFNLDDPLPVGSPLSPSMVPHPSVCAGVFSFEGVGGQASQQQQQQQEEEGDSITNIACFSMMLDVLIKQAEVQEWTAHLGVYNEHNKELLSILSNMLNAEWEGTHSCSGGQEITSCPFCAVSAQWFSLSAKVMEFLAPRDEIKVPEKDLPKVEEIPKGASRRNMINNINGGSKHNSGSEKEEKEDDEEEDLGVQFEVDRFPKHLQMLHALLKSLEEQTDPDGVFFLVKTLRFLCLHAECLNYTVKDYGVYVQYCLRRMLMPTLWKLLQAKYSHLASMCVPLLLHCITLPTGPDVFWKLIEGDFNNDDWRARFSAVEKVTVLARLLETEPIRKNQQIMTSLSHAFCCLIGSLNDINSFVVQKATVFLETVKDSAIKCMCYCLEFQFDSVIKDRTMILQKMYLLSVVLKNKDIFTWEFFLSRFDSLCLEAQLDLEGTGDIACLQDLESSDKHSDTFLKKINRARFALARTDSIRSVSGSVYAKVPYRRAASVPMHLLAKTLPNHAQVKAPVEKPEPSGLRHFIQQIAHMTEEFLNPLLKKKKDKSPYKRQQSAPQFRTRGSRFGLGLFSNYMFPGGNLREFTDEESNFAALLQRAMDLDGVDRETVHHLVTLLMKFMVYSDEDQVTEDRNMSRAQNIVLRHLNVLLGFNQTEKAFSVPPYKLRYSTVFNAYITALPMVLDKNFSLGNIILPVSMALLQYCPSPQRYASDYQPPNYSLWLLEPTNRLSWLQSLSVILYKYQYNSSQASGIIQTLVRLTINTVDAQLHRCKKLDEVFGPASPFVPRNRSRDTSNVSTGDLGDIVETESPPKSPLGSHKATSTTDTVTFNLSSTTTSAIYRKTDSTRTEETDIESLSPTSKVTSPLSKGSPPRPSSPTAVEHVGTDPMSPCDFGGIRGGRSGLASAAAANTEMLTLMGNREQPKRLAEYNRNSWAELEESGDVKRTLEQSVEAFVLGQCGSANKGSSLYSEVMGSGAVKDPLSRTTLSPIHTPQDTVDKKIVEQLEEFESTSENRRRLAEMPTTLPVPWGHEKPILSRPMSTVLEELKETDEETESRTSFGRSEESASANQSEREGETEGDSGNKEDGDDMSPVGSPGPEQKPRPQYRQRKGRRTGLSTVELQKAIPELGDLSSLGGKSSSSTRRSRRSEIMNKMNQGSQKKSVGSIKYQNEQVLVERCSQCHTTLEQYDEETISMCIICLATLIHREPTLAAPLLLDMICAVCKIASSTLYPWQNEISGLIIPGNCISVARQFIRCTIHQLAPNGILTQLFLTELEDPDMLKTIATALVDFSELNCMTALQILLEGINETKNLTVCQLAKFNVNLATFLDCMSLEGNTTSWNPILTQFEIFFRRLMGNMSQNQDTTAVLKIINHVLKMPGIASVKGILEPFSKILSHTIQHCRFKLQQILDMCSLCSRVFSKERDKLLLSRAVIFELNQALKFKSLLPDENLLLLVQFVCLDAGGTLGPTNIVEELSGSNYQMFSQILATTNAAECMKPHLSDCVEFVADLHTINKVKNNMKGGSDNLNEDTLGSLLKAGIAQYVALEFTKGNGRDNRAINRYLPWLYHPPSAIQSGPREFVDCVGHIRLLSWLLLGSLTHSAITKASGSIVCQPLPLEGSTYIADHIMVIMTGFAEQSKASVLHMSSLFHAFILCQLWTMYCESYAGQHSPGSENYITSHSVIMDFWGRVTPGVLQLLSHSQVLAEMVNLHFLSLMEALQECNSTVLSKLFPMWTPILYSYNKQLPGHLQVRLQMCQNWEPKEANKSDSSQVDSDVLLKWLKRLQFKLGQIEVQSSAATQFYSV